MRAHSGSPWTHIIWLHSNNQTAETHSWTGCCWLGGPKEERLEGSHELSPSQNPMKSHVPPSPLLNDRVRGFPGGSEGLESACNGRDLGLIRGSGRFPGEENGYPLQYSCPENSMDRGAWWATVHGVTKSRTQLTDTLAFHCQQQVTTKKHTTKGFLFYPIMEPILNETFTTQKVLALSNSGLKPPL